MIDGPYRAVLVDAGRVVDDDRPHRRRGAPSPATAALLADYQAAMRDELRAVLVEVAGKPAPAGLGLVAAAPAMRPPLGDRARLWDLAIKLGRELGAAIDADPLAGDARPALTTGRRRGRVDYG